MERRILALCVAVSGVVFDDGVVEIPIQTNNDVYGNEIRTLTWDPEASDAWTAARDFSRRNKITGRTATGCTRDGCILKDIVAALEQELGRAPSLEHGEGLRLQRPARPRPAASGGAIALYTGHDANVALTDGDGNVVCVLELERLFERRYYMSPRTHEAFSADWLRALEVVSAADECRGPDQRPAAVTTSREISGGKPMKHRYRRAW